MAKAFWGVLMGTLIFVGSQQAQAQSCWEGNFPFGAFLRWCVDPPTASTLSMKVIVPVKGAAPIKSEDDDHKQDIEHEIRHRITVNFGGLVNQLPIRVMARYNIEKGGDAIFAWDEWNNVKCPQQTLNVDANNCWFHQTDWHQMTKKPLE